MKIIIIGNGFDKAFFKLDCGFPAGLFPGKVYVGTTLLGVIPGQGFKDEPGRAAGQGNDLLGQLPDGELAGIAHVHGADKVVGRGHEADHTFDEIIHVAEGTCLLAIAIDGDGLAKKGLDDEVGHDPAVIGMHFRTVGIEDAANLDRQMMLAPVGEEQGLGTALSFIVAGPYAVGIDMAPVAFHLGVHFGVSVDFAGGSLEDAGMHPLGKAQHIGRAVHAGLDGLHGIVLVVNGRCRAGKIVDLLDFHIEREGHIMTHELKAGIVQKFLDIGSGTGKKVVHAENFVTFVKQTLAQMCAKKAGTAGDQNTFTLFVELHVYP